MRLLSLVLVIGGIAFVSSRFTYRWGEERGRQVKLQEWHQAAEENRKAAGNLWDEIDKSPIEPPQDFNKADGPGRRKKMN